MGVEQPASTQEAPAAPSGPAAPSAVDVDTTLDAQIAEGLLGGDIDIIRESERSKPFIGDQESLDALKAEYINGSQVFIEKISALQQRYGSMRRTRGDGNCFFRSYIFRYLEWLLQQQNEDESQRFIKCLQGWKGKLLESGYDAIVFEDPMDMLLQLAQAILIGPGIEGGMSGQQLLENFRDDTWSNTVVMLLRFITSAEIKRRHDHFEPFVLGQYDVDVASFCERSVDVMGEESDHIHAQALTDALQVPVRIIQVDSSSSPVEAGMVDMQPEGSTPQQQATPAVQLLYRPGHYDILYPL